MTDGEARDVLCTPIEKSFWTFAMLQHDEPTHVWRQIDVRGPLDEAALERALGDLVASNDALRTTYRMKRVLLPGQREGKRALTRTVHAEISWNLRTIDLRRCDAAEKQQRLSTLKEGERTRLFDMERGPLFQVTVVRSEEAAYSILFTISHLIMDATSFKMWLDDLGTYYNHHRAFGTSPTWPRRPQFSDYVAWYWRTVDHPGYFEKTIDYWRNYLDVPRGPSVAPEPERSDGSEEHNRPLYSQSMSVELSEPLAAFNRRHRLVATTIPLAAYALVLSRFANVKVVHMANVFHGRTNQEHAQTIGLLINAIVSKVRVDDSVAVMPWLKAIQGDYLDALDHGVIAMDTVMEHLRAELPARFYFSLHGVDPEASAEVSLFDGVECSFVETDVSAPSPFEVGLAARCQGRRLEFKVSAWRSLYSEATVAQMADSYAAMMQGLMSAPQGTVGAL